MTSEPREAGRIAGLPASREGFEWKPGQPEHAAETLSAAGGSRLPEGGRQKGHLPGNDSGAE
ncbi:hypothetical protein [Paenibacillus tarimensis]|uniref:hypothetical protein n=1 Tax=Paenibacillus tarimensis TaxID=416012 RepID=UPI001F2EA429|nr:hypothetical protein [Paenibacillus tarimensis]MCF2946264.1 hypothetical protein [Paenibacillus tarimensis]